VQVELFHQAPAVRLHRVDAQAQLTGDIFVRFALGDELQHLAFPGRQQVHRVGNVPPVVRQNGIGHRGTEAGITARYGADGVEQRIVVGILDEIAFGAGWSQHLADVDRVAVHAEGEDAAARQAFDDATRPSSIPSSTLQMSTSMTTTSAPVFTSLFNGFKTVLAFGDDLHVRLGGQDHPDAAPHDGGGRPPVEYVSSSPSRSLRFAGNGPRLDFYP
jgi:hypothetical protein